MSVVPESCKSLSYWLEKFRTYPMPRRQVLFEWDGQQFVPASLTLSEHPASGAVCWFLGVLPVAAEMSPVSIGELVSVIDETITGARQRLGAEAAAGLPLGLTVGEHTGWMTAVLEDDLPIPADPDTPLTIVLCVPA